MLAIAYRRLDRNGPPGLSGIAESERPLFMTPTVERSGKVQRRATESLLRDLISIATMRVHRAVYSEFEVVHERSILSAIATL
jgi:hypothetical protein